MTCSKWRLRKPRQKNRAWYKREKEKFDRIHIGGYVDLLEQQFGPIENAEAYWLMKLTDK